MSETFVYILEEKDKVVVDWVIVERLAGLLRLQQSFFKNRDRRTLEECKRREIGFLAWYDDVRAELVQNGDLKG